ncbi:MAG: flagellar basal body-associated protein FliL [Vampirovibrionales bacterium]
MMMMMMMTAKPVKPKALKPKTTGNTKPSDDDAPLEAVEATPASKSSKTAFDFSGDSLTMMQVIILAVVMLICSIVGPAAAFYFVGPMVMKPLVAQAPAEEGDEGEQAEAKNGHGDASTGHGEGSHAKEGASQVGLTLKFDEFAVNLKKDPALRGNQYLSAKMSIAVAVPPEKDCLTPLIAPPEHGDKEHAAEGGGHGGGHGEAAPAGSPIELCQKGFQESMTPFIPTLRDIVNTAFMKRTATQIASVDGQESLKDEITTEMNTVLNNGHYNVLRVNFENFVVQR